LTNFSVLNPFIAEACSIAVAEEEEEAVLSVHILTEVGNCLQRLAASNHELSASSAFSLVFVSQ